MGIIQVYGCLFDLLYNNGMLSVLNRMASIWLLMGTYNIQFHDKIRISNICFLELSKNFVGTKKTSWKQP